MWRLPPEGDGMAADADVLEADTLPPMPLGLEPAADAPGLAQLARELEAEWQRRPGSPNARTASPGPFGARFGAGREREASPHRLAHLPAGEPQLDSPRPWRGGGHRGPLSPRLGGFAVPVFPADCGPSPPASGVALDGDSAAITARRCEAVAAELRELRWTQQLDCPEERGAQPSKSAALHDEVRLATDQLHRARDARRREIASEGPLDALPGDARDEDFVGGGARFREELRWAQEIAAFGGGGAPPGGGGPAAARAGVEVGRARAVGGEPPPRRGEGLAEARFQEELQWVQEIAAFGGPPDGAPAVQAAPADSLPSALALTGWPQPTAAAAAPPLAAGFDVWAKPGAGIFGAAAQAGGPAPLASRYLAAPRAAGTGELGLLEYVCERNAALAEELDAVDRALAEVAATMMEEQRKTIQVFATAVTSLGRSVRGAAPKVLCMAWLLWVAFACDAGRARAEEEAARAHTASAEQVRAARIQATERALGVQPAPEPAAARGGGRPTGREAAALKGSAIHRALGSGSDPRALAAAWFQLWRADSAARRTQAAARSRALSSFGALVMLQSAAQGSGSPCSAPFAAWRAEAARRRGQRQRADRWAGRMNGYQVFASTLQLAWRAWSGLLSRRQTLQIMEEAVGLRDRSVLLTARWAYEAGSYWCIRAVLLVWAGCCRNAVPRHEDVRRQVEQDLRKEASARLRREACARLGVLAGMSGRRASELEPWVLRSAWLQWSSSVRRKLAEALQGELRAVRVTERDVTEVARKKFLMVEASTSLQAQVADRSFAEHSLWLIFYLWKLGTLASSMVGQVEALREGQSASASQLASAHKQVEKALKTAETEYMSILANVQVARQQQSSGLAQLCDARSWRATACLWGMLCWHAWKAFLWRRSLEKLQAESLNQAKAVTDSARKLVSVKRLGRILDLFARNEYAPTVTWLLLHTWRQSRAAVSQQAAMRRVEASLVVPPTAAIEEELGLLRRQAQELKEREQQGKRMALEQGLAGREQRARLGGSPAPAGRLQNVGEAGQEVKRDDLVDLQAGGAVQATSAWGAPAPGTPPRAQQRPQADATQALAPTTGVAWRPDEQGLFRPPPRPPGAAPAAAPALDLDAEPPPPPRPPPPLSGGPLRHRSPGPGSRSGTEEARPADVPSEADTAPYVDSFQSLVVVRSRNWRLACDFRGEAETALLRAGELQEAMLPLLEQAARHVLRPPASLGALDAAGEARLDRVMKLAAEVEAQDLRLRALCTQRGPLAASLHKAATEAVDLVLQATPALAAPGGPAKMLARELLELRGDARRLREASAAFLERVGTCRQDFASLAEALCELTTAAAAAVAAAGTAGGGAERAALAGASATARALLDTVASGHESLQADSEGLLQYLEASEFLRNRVVCEQEEADAKAHARGGKQPDRDAILRETFNMVDKDGDGLISRAEWERAGIVHADAAGAEETTFTAPALAAALRGGAGEGGHARGDPWDADQEGDEDVQPRPRPRPQRQVEAASVPTFGGGAFPGLQVLHQAALAPQDMPTVHPASVAAMTALLTRGEGL